MGLGCQGTLSSGHGTSGRGLAGAGDGASSRGPSPARRRRDDSSRPPRRPERPSASRCVTGSGPARQRQGQRLRVIGKTSAHAADSAQLRRRRHIESRSGIPLWHALDSMEDARGLLRGHDMSSRVGRSPARPLESSTGMGRATLGTWIGQRSLPARGAPFGAVVSLVAVSQVTVRRARAERREAARLAVAAAGKPLQLELARYTYAAGQRTSSKRDNDVNGQFVVPAGGQQESPLLVGVFSLS